MVGVNRFHGHKVSLSSKLANPQTSFPRVFDGANLWPSLFQGCGGIVAGAGRVLEGVLLLGLCLAGPCGAFLRTQEKRPCGLNFVAGMKGPPAGLDVVVRDHGLVWRFLSKLLAPEVSLMRGNTAAWSRRGLPYPTGQEEAEEMAEGISAANLTPQLCTGPEAKPPTPSATALGA